MEIVDLIEEIKAKHRISVAEIARRIDVAPSTLTRYMTGERTGSPRMSTVRSLMALHGGYGVDDDVKGVSAIAAPPPSPKRPAPNAFERFGVTTRDIPLLRHVFGQEYDPNDPGDVLDILTLPSSLVREGSYIVELSGSAPIGSASMYMPAGTKVVVDPSRPLRPGAPVLVQFSLRSEGPGVMVDARAVYLYAEQDEHEVFFTHAATGDLTAITRYEFETIVPVVALMYV